MTYKYANVLRVLFSNIILMPVSALPDISNQREEPSTPLQATYAGAKRRIAALEEQIQTLKEAGSKRKRS